MESENVGMTWGRIKELFRKEGNECAIFNELEDNLLEVATTWGWVKDELLETGGSDTGFIELEESVLQVEMTWDRVRRVYG